MKSKIFLSTIFHERFLPFKHKFKYVVPSLLIDPSEFKILKKNIFLFSVNSFNLFSFYDKDHGYRDHRSINEFIKNYLDKYKIDYYNLKIQILCFPRILGYVFNPLSIFYCYDEKKLIAIFYEVKNTSNEQHTYVFRGKHCSENFFLTHKCSKQFYVSPFIEMRGYYKFKNKMDSNKININIDLLNYKNEKILTASQFGKLKELNSISMIKFLSLNPLFGFKVIAAILFESLRIIFKGGKYYARKKKPDDTVNLEGTF